ncbi:hypothetical protein Q3G72_024623 [Acer saccharum]|nr:hypothetical protein Q3G72_024623 [Acer saccharum]
MHDMMSCMFGPTLGSAIVNGALGLNTFHLVPPMVNRVREISFLAGQALGYYGSWALFALSHHFIIWMAAEMSQPDRKDRFRGYAVLGDDVVIADGAVAKQYRMLLDNMGVTISEAKSLCSHNGTLEFAKRFWTKSAQVDFSPISLQALHVHRTTLGLCQIQQKYNVTSLSVMLRLGGAGYKVRAKMDHHLSKRWQRLKIVTSKLHGSHSLPLEYWLGRGSPLNPYLKGTLVSHMLKAFKPKAMKPIPDRFVFDGEKEILERTVTHNWMCQWLSWVLWYHTILMEPDPTLESLLAAPITATSWRRSELNPKWFQFGLVWHLYDMGEGWSTGHCPSHYVLDRGREDGEIWCLIGGKQGSQFITGPSGLPPLGIWENQA